MNIRKRIKLATMEACQAFVQAMNETQDEFVLENEDGTVSLPGKSMLSVLQMAFGAEPCFYAVNKTNDGAFAVLNRFRDY